MTIMSHFLMSIAIFFATSVTLLDARADDSTLGGLLPLLQSIDVEDVKSMAGGVPVIDYAKQERFLKSDKTNSRTVISELLPMIQNKPSGFRRRAYHAVGYLCTNTEALDARFIAYVQGYFDCRSTFEDDLHALQELKRVIHRIKSIEKLKGMAVAPEKPTGEAE